MRSEKVERPVVEMLTWDLFWMETVLYSKYSSQRVNIPSGDILYFYHGKKYCNSAHCFIVLYDIVKMLVDYSARKLLLKRVWLASWEAGLLLTLLPHSIFWTEAESLSTAKLSQWVPGEPSLTESKHQPRLKTERRLFWSPKRTVRGYFNPKTTEKF